MVGFCLFNRHAVRVLTYAIFSATPSMMGTQLLFEVRAKWPSYRAPASFPQPLTIRQTTPTSRSLRLLESLARYVGAALRTSFWNLISFYQCAALAEKWGKAAHYYNSCGPTEVHDSNIWFGPLLTLIFRLQVTIVNTVHLHTPGEFLSIGAPVPNTNVYVLDEDMKPCPIGQPGVMWAGGACVSKGYVNLPEKTAERYMRDPFVNDGCALFSLHSPRSCAAR